LQQTSMSSKREYGCLLIIALAGTLLRFFRLGELSFSGDEEITVMAAQALLDGWPPELPGGLIYVRALIFTVFEAIAVWLGGTQEAVLRAVPVLAALPRILGAWWLARAFLPASLALTCAGLLALSPFDIEHSRMARMYSPFATFDLLFVAAIVHLTLGAGGVLRTVSFGVMSMWLHALTIFHAPLAWLGALAPNRTWASRAWLITIGAAVLSVYGLLGHLERLSYQDMGIGLGRASDLPPALDEHVTRLYFALDPLAAKLLLAACALAAVVLILLSFTRMTNVWARVLTPLAGVLFVLSSPVLAGTALLAAYIFEGSSQCESSRGAGSGLRLAHPFLPILSAGVLLCLTWMLLGALSHPPEEGAVRAAASILLGYPAPNWLDVVRASPALAALASLGILMATWRGSRDPHLAPILLILVAAALAPALGTGLIKRSEALRFQIHALAPMLVLAVYGSWYGVRALAPSGKTLAWAAAIGLTLIAVRPDRGLAIVLRDHGPIQEPFAIFTVAPDHRGAGLFVRERAAPSDLIVAEDSQQQRFYAGRVDYWLRRPQDANTFLTLAEGSSAPRDIYTGAGFLPDFNSLLILSRSRPEQSLWLITSAEAEASERFYRTPETSQALEQIKGLAQFVARDGITRVYRIRAGEVTAPDSLARKDHARAETHDAQDHGARDHNTQDHEAQDHRPVTGPRHALWQLENGIPEVL